MCVRISANRVELPEIDSENEHCLFRWFGGDKPGAVRERYHGLVSGVKQPTHLKQRTSWILHFRKMTTQSDDDLPIRSRYADIDGVVIDEELVPESFRHLMDDALEWSIGDDVERDAYMKRMNSGQLRRFVDAVSPHFSQITEWCRERRSATPVPDEVVVFDQLTQAVAEARLELDRSTL